MKPIEIEITETVQFVPKWIIISAEVRYWEDAEVNGVRDEDGTLIPFREGLLWKPRIDIDNGTIDGWPEGTTADIHYKVCDQGEYWTQNKIGIRLKYKDAYVPDFLGVTSKGYGDYIIMKVGADGKIEGWKEPSIDGSEWELCELLD